MRTHQEYTSNNASRCLHTYLKDLRNIDLLFSQRIRMFNNYVLVTYMLERLACYIHFNNVRRSSSIGLTQIHQAPNRSQMLMDGLISTERNRTCRVIIFCTRGVRNLLGKIAVLRLLVWSFGV